MKASEMQVAGEHYKTSIQHWDYVVGVLQNRYLEGQVTKYITRWRKKAGRQDLEKARHYLLKLQEEFVAGRVTQPPWPKLQMNVTLMDYKPPFKMAYMMAAARGFPLTDYLHVNELGELEREVTIRIICWRTLDDLNTILARIDELIKSC